MNYFDSVLFAVLLFKLCVVVNGGITVKEKMSEVFAWKQMTYDFDRVKYLNSSDFERNPAKIQFVEDLTEDEKFYIQYNNVPVGFDVFRERVFVTVPRRRHGIPSTLNYVILNGTSSPSLRPYPNVQSVSNLVSVYRPRLDQCDRLWIVDTGLVEIPDARQQIRLPQIVVYDLNTDKEVLRYQLKKSDLVNSRSPGGLTSITVDVDPKACEDAFAYITDLATNGLIVFSMKQKDSWRIKHGSFEHDPAAMNFTVAGNVIDWRDGIFSLALSDGGSNIIGRTAFYHPFISTQEYSINTLVLKHKYENFPSDQVKFVGSRGSLSQSGSHAFHSPSETLLLANVAHDAIQCWNTGKLLSPENVTIVVQDSQKLSYISDLKVVGDDVWVLVNQMPKFVYATLNPSDFNFFIHRGKIQNLIQGTPCDKYI